MNIYVETNFVLELTFEQEQYDSCEEILQLSEADKITLIIPAYSLAEPHEKLIRQARHRRKLQQSLDLELRQLSRTTSYLKRVQRIQDFTNLIIQSIEEEQSRFIQYRERLLKIGKIITLDSEILNQAALCEDVYDLTPQDALVYASVLKHLRGNLPEKACFLNRNTKDFTNPDILNELGSFNCRMIPSFEHGCKFIQSQL